MMMINTVRVSTISGEDQAPCVKLGDKRLGLHPVNPVRNAHRHRQPVPEPAPKTSGAFNPANVLLDHATGRRHKEED
jgi:hypothetical protein